MNVESDLSMDASESPKERLLGEIGLKMHRAVKSDGSKDYGTVVEGASTKRVLLKVKGDSRNRTAWSTFEGLLWASMAGGFQATMGAASKGIQTFSSLEFVFYRSLGMLIFSLPIISYRRESFPYHLKPMSLLILVSSFSLVFNFTQFYAFSELPIGDVSAIIFNTPIFTAILARLILKERVSWLTIISLVTSLIGMLVTIKLPLIITSSDYRISSNTKRSLIGYASAITAAVASSASICTLRKLKDVDPAYSVCIQGFMVSLASACVMPLFGNFTTLPCSNISWILMGMTVLGYLGSQFRVVALNKEDATVVAILIRTTEIVVSYAFQVFLFGDAIDAYSGLGAIIIFASGLTMPFQKWAEKLPDGSPWKIGCLLR